METLEQRMETLEKKQKTLEIMERKTRLSLEKQTNYC